MLAAPLDTVMRWLWPLPTNSGSRMEQGEATPIIQYCYESCWNTILKLVSSPGWVPTVWEEQWLPLVLTQLCSISWSQQPPDLTSPGGWAVRAAGGVSWPAWWPVLTPSAVMVTWQRLMLAYPRLVLWWMQVWWPSMELILSQLSGSEMIKMILLLSNYIKLN